MKELDNYEWQRWDTIRTKGKLISMLKFSNVVLLDRLATQFIIIRFMEVYV